jgi:hypothetical protein
MHGEKQAHAPRVLPVLLAAHATVMSVAILRAGLSGLGAAHMLAAPASAMRLTMTRASLSCIKAALLFTPLALAMRLAVRRAAKSLLGAALVLAAFAPAMRPAVRRALERRVEGVGAKIAAHEVAALLTPRAPVVVLVCILDARAVSTVPHVLQLGGSTPARRFSINERMR